MSDKPEDIGGVGRVVKIGMFDPQIVTPIVRLCDKDRARLDRIAEVLSLKWSKEKPTKSGWYWYRLNESGGRIVCLSAKWNEPLEVTFTGNDGVFQLSSLDGEWAGPIPEPGE